MCAKRSARRAAKKSVSRRSVNARAALSDQVAGHSPADPSNQDPKHRIGQYGGAGEAHQSTARRLGGESQRPTRTDRGRGRKKRGQK